MSDDEEWQPRHKKRYYVHRPKPKPKTPYEILIDRINSTYLPQKVREEAINRLEFLDNDKEKLMEWINSLLKIPFDNLISMPISKRSTKDEIAKYFQSCTDILNEAVYGMNSVKEEVLNYIAQFVSTNSKSMPRILGLCGSPGVGKTAIIRKGFAEALNRPIKCISMGGIRDSNYFLGHDYTYSGSRYGMIVQSLIELKCMNGIMYFDEVDKISNSFDGKDIQNFLIHITDPVQNNTFHDKYFAGIDIDLSKVIFVFSFNDASLIDPILKDRIYIVNVDDPTEKEKVVIGCKYLLKEVEKNVGFKRTDIRLSDEVVTYILRRHCREQKGVRGLKKCIETILLKLNTARYLGKLQKYKCLKNGIKLPITITTEMVDELINKEPEDKFFNSMYM
jgi:ATP-dependent Lon protease